MTHASELAAHQDNQADLLKNDLQEAFIDSDQAVITLGAGAVEKVVYLNAGPTTHLLSMPDKAGVNRQLQVRGGVIEADGTALPYNKVGLDVETGEVGAVRMDAEDGLDFTSVDSL